jgi:hypothetical protein
VCEHLGLKEGDVKRFFVRMTKEGVIQQKKKGGRYEVPASQPVVSMTVIAPAPVTPSKAGGGSKGVTTKAFYREMEDSAVVTQVVEEDIDESQPVEGSATASGPAPQQQRFNQSTLQIAGRKPSVVVSTATLSQIVDN